ncbi:FHA domain-containing protein [Williamsia sp. D3]|uniref:FHA domain-containing protein FhaB/FipA n=1 Tax=Williamsia sp. D3 TaxID=1313067 RepID=UPI00041705CE
MQGIVLQLTRVGFLLLLWLLVWAVLRVIRTDVYAATGQRPMTRYERRNRGGSPAKVKGGARYLVVTHGALANTRITLGTQPVLLGRADDSTLVLTDEYASERHARLIRRGDDWYVEDSAPPTAPTSTVRRSPPLCACRSQLRSGSAKP